MAKLNRSAKRFARMGEEKQKRFFRRINSEKIQLRKEIEEKKKPLPVLIKPKRVVVRERLPFEDVDFSLFTMESFHAHCATMTQEFEILDEEEMNELQHCDANLQIYEELLLEINALPLPPANTTSSDDVDEESNDQSLEPVLDILKISKLLILTCDPSFFEKNDPSHRNSEDADLDENDDNVDPTLDLEVKEQSTVKEEDECYQMVADNLLHKLPAFIQSIEAFNAYAIALSLLSERLSKEQPNKALRLIKVLTTLLSVYQDSAESTYFLLRVIKPFFVAESSNLRSYALNYLLDLCCAAPFPFAKTIIKFVLFLSVEYRMSYRLSPLSQAIDAFLDDAVLHVLSLDGELAYIEVYNTVQYMASKLDKCDPINPRIAYFKEVQNQETCLLFQSITFAYLRLIEACPQINFKADVHAFIQIYSTIFNFSKRPNLLPLQLLCLETLAKFMNTVPGLYIPLVEMFNAIFRCSPLLSDEVDDKNNTSALPHLDPSCVSVVYQTVMDPREVSLKGNREYVFNQVFDLIAVYTRKVGGAFAFNEHVFYLVKTLKVLLEAGLPQKLHAKLQRTIETLEKASAATKHERENLPYGPTDLKKVKARKNTAIQ